MSSPFLKVWDRVELWRASLALGRRLGELPVRGGDSTSESTDLSERVTAVTKLVARRREWLRSLLKMAAPTATASDFELRGAAVASESGQPERKGTESSSSREALARNWADLAKLAQAVHAGVVQALSRAVSKPGPDRPAWIAPAFVLDLEENPIRRKRDQDNLLNWAWLADRYRHEFADVHGFADTTDTFFERAALECPRESEIQQEPVVKFNFPESAQSRPRLSPRQTSTDIQCKWELDATDGGPPRQVAMAVLDPDDSRLQISSPEPARLEVLPLAPNQVRVHVEWDDGRGLGSKPPPSGFILQVRMPGGRAFHLLVPIDIVPDYALPRLALRSDPAQVQETSVDPLRLRTLPDRQPFFVAVRNPSQVDRKVIVDVMAGESVIATSADKDKPFLEVKAGSTLVVPGFGESAVKPNEPLPEVPQNLAVRLRDAANGQEFERLKLRPVIASPLEYIELVRAQFTPPRPGTPNRLDVILRALPQMAAPPCRVRLDIPNDPELFPAFVEPPAIGKLESVVKPGGELLTLNAEGIKLKPTANDEGRFSLSVDGIARALWYQTRFVLEGQNQRVRPVAARCGSGSSRNSSSSLTSRRN